MNGVGGVAVREARRRGHGILYMTSGSSHNNNKPIVAVRTG